MAVAVINWPHLWGCIAFGIALALVLWACDPDIRTDSQ